MLVINGLKILPFPMLAPPENKTAESFLNGVLF